MNEGGKIDREVVIAVLRVSGVEVHGLDDGPSDMLVLSKGKRIEGQRLPLMVERKMLLLPLAAVRDSNRTFLR